MYKIYYHIPSRAKYLSNTSAIPTDSIEDVYLLINQLKKSGDVIFIYDCALMQRYSISKSIKKNEDNYIFLLELVDGDFKQSLSINSLISCLDHFKEIIVTPEDYGFKSSF